MSDSSLYDARDVRRAEDGGWWVLANAAPFILRYDSSGAVVRRLGRRGRGPTDFLRPWIFVGEAGAGTPPLVWDVGRKALIAVDTLGQARAIMSMAGALGPVRNDIELVTFGAPFQAREAGPAIVFAQFPGEISNTSHLRRMAILRLDRATETVDTLLSVPGPPPDTASAASSLVPLPLWDLCAGSTLAVLGAGGASVHRLGMSGDTTGSLEIPVGDRAPRPFTEAAIERHVRHLLVNERLSFGQDTSTVGEEATRLARRFRGEYPEHEPAFVRMLCDSSSRIWLQRFSLIDHPVGYGNEWLMLDGAGGRRVFRLPGGFTPVQVHTGEMIGLMTDADGATWPARLTILARTAGTGG